MIFLRPSVELFQVHCTREPSNFYFVLIETVRRVDVEARNPCICSSVVYTSIRAYCFLKPFLVLGHQLLSSFRAQRKVTNKHE